MDIEFIVPSSAARDVLAAMLPVATDLSIATDEQGEVHDGAASIRGLDAEGLERLRAWAGEWDVEIPTVTDEIRRRQLVRLSDGRTVRIEGPCHEIFGQPILIAAATGHPMALEFVLDRSLSLDERGRLACQVFLTGYGPMLRPDAVLTDEERRTVENIRASQEDWNTLLGLPSEGEMFYAKEVSEGMFISGEIILESTIEGPVDG